MIDCYNCKAKSNCIATTERGSVICMINRMQYGGTHADDLPKSRPVFCGYCGERLRIIGNKQFCNNVYCVNRFEDV